MDENTRRKRETGWLEVLHTYFQHELVHNHFFRTAVDNWAMYNRGGSFLNKKGNPKFFNAPNSGDERLRLMDFHSEAAWSIMNGDPVDKRLIVDHAVPVSIIHSIIRASRPSSPDDIRAILLKTYRLGVLTYKEDAIPELPGSVMPDGWQFGKDSPFARYERAGILGRVNGEFG